MKSNYLVFLIILLFQMNLGLSASEEAKIPEKKGETQALRQAGTRIILLPKTKELDEERFERLYGEKPIERREELERMLLQNTRNLQFIQNELKEALESKGIRVVEVPVESGPRETLLFLRDIVVLTANGECNLTTGIKSEYRKLLKKHYGSNPGLPLYSYIKQKMETMGFCPTDRQIIEMDEDPRFNSALPHTCFSAESDLDGLPGWLRSQSRILRDCFCDGGDMMWAHTVDGRLKLIIGLSSVLANSISCRESNGQLQFSLCDSDSTLKQMSKDLGLESHDDIVMLDQMRYHLDVFLFEGPNGIIAYDDPTCGSGPLIYGRRVIIHNLNKKHKFLEGVPGIILNQQSSASEEDDNDKIYRIQFVTNKGPREFPYKRADFTIIDTCSALRENLKRSLEEAGFKAIPVPMTFPPQITGRKGKKVNHGSVMLNNPVTGFCPRDQSYFMFLLGVANKPLMSAWKSYVEKHVYGDLPVDLRFIGGVDTTYGTPFLGAEHFSVDSMAGLHCLTAEVFVPDAKNSDSNNQDAKNSDSNNQDTKNPDSNDEEDLFLSGGGAGNGGGGGSGRS